MKYHHEEEKIGKAYDSEIMGRLLSYLKPYKLLFFGSLAMGFLVTGAELVLPYLINLVIDRHLTPLVTESGGTTAEAALEGIAFFSGLYLAVLAGRLLFDYAHRYLLYLTGHNVMYDMREEIFEKLLRLPISFIADNPVGRLVTRATNDVEAINEMYSEVLVELIKNILMVTGILLIMFSISWKLTLLILTLGPITYWITIEFRKRVRKAYRTVRRKLAKLNAYVAEHLSGMKIIQLFVQEENSKGEFQNINNEEFEAEMKQIKVYGVFRPLVSLMRFVATALVLWYGGLQVVSTAFTIGNLYLFTKYIEKLFRPIRNLSQQYNTLQKAMASAERIFQLLDEEPETYEGGSLLPSGRRKIDGEISFENVWFRYDEEGEWVLKDVSFRARPGERIAIVGPTGAGKSTIIKLLTRLYEVQKGTIRIDGKNVRNVDLKELRSQVAVVLQDVFLFSDDIKSNIRLKDESIPEEEVRRAAEFVRANEFIHDLPEGYDTDIKVRGGILSEGQRQLIAFSRAVAADPAILVLDEATADIDSRTEEKILDSMDRILEGRTSIAIAHRLSTIENSDRILVLDNGQIVQRGPHKELMEQGGLYRALYELQFSRKSEARPEHQPSG